MSWFLSILIAIAIISIICGIAWLIIWLEYEFSIPATGILIMLGMIFIIVCAIHELIF